MVAQHRVYVTDSEVARRFRDEAKVTGRLQHPGIPPVHDLGTLPDGRPFLAMKLIRGRTLHDHLQGRPSPAHERGRFLAVFETIRDCFISTCTTIPSIPPAMQPRWSASIARFQFIRSAPAASI